MRHGRAGGARFEGFAECPETGVKAVSGEAAAEHAPGRAEDVDGVLDDATDAVDGPAMVVRSACRGLDEAGSRSIGIPEWSSRAPSAVSAAARHDDPRAGRRGGGGSEVGERLLDRSRRTGRCGFRHQGGSSTAQLDADPRPDTVGVTRAERPWAGRSHDDRSPGRTRRIIAPCGPSRPWPTGRHRITAMSSRHGLPRAHDPPPAGPGPVGRRGSRPRPAR